MALKIAVNALNDTAGPSGLVPTLLVFVSLPRIPFNPQALTGQAEILQAMHMAIREMSRLVYQTRIFTSLHSNVPAVEDRSFKPGDEGLMYREKPFGKWIGPKIIVDLKDKLLALDSEDRFLRGSVENVKLNKEKEFLNKAIRRLEKIKLLLQIMLRTMAKED